VAASSIPGAAANRRYVLSLPLLIGVIVYATTLSIGSFTLDDPDPYWQIVTGRWILAHHTVPHQDPFSYTMFGAPWVAHEWLAEVGAAVLYDHLGWAGLVLAAAVALAAAVSLLLRALLRYLDPAAALIGTLGFWGLSLPHALARPHLFAMPILVAWLALLVDARNKERAPSPWAALLMVPWANLHGGYLLGDAFVVMFAVEMALDQPDWASLRRQAPGWLWFFALSVLAGCVTPNGLEALTLPFRLARMDTMMSLVKEWQAPNFQQGGEPLEAWLLLALLGALSFGIRLPVTRVAMLLLLLHLALTHRRFAELLGLAAPLLVAPSLAPQIVWRSATLPKTKLSWVRHLAGAGGLAFAGGVVALLAWGVIARGVVNDSARYTPAAAVAFVQANHVAGPVLNSYNFGGYLIFLGIAPYIDSRAELYGDAFIKRDKDPALAPALLKQYHVAWTLLDLKDPRVGILDGLRGWRRLYADDRAVVHVNDNAASF